MAEGLEFMGRLSLGYIAQGDIGVVNQQDSSANIVLHSPHEGTRSLRSSKWFGCGIANIILSGDVSGEAKRATMAMDCSCVVACFDGHS